MYKHIGDYLADNFLKCYLRRLFAFIKINTRADCEFLLTHLLSHKISIQLLYCYGLGNNCVQNVGRVVYHLEQSKLIKKEIHLIGFFFKRFT